MRVAVGTTQNLRVKTGRSLRNGWHAGIPFEKCGCHTALMHEPCTLQRRRAALVLGLGIHCARRLLPGFDVLQEVLGDSGHLLGRRMQRVSR